MNPQTQFCHNPACRARGQVGQGNIHVHSQTAQRYRCTTCGQTFAATTATPFYRLRTAADMMTLVLITTLVQLVRSCGRSLAILVCVDGLASYVTAFLHVSGPLCTPAVVGGRGWSWRRSCCWGKWVKPYVKRRVASVEHRVMRGTEAAIAAVLAATHSGTGINTAYIERLNATFRASLAPLVRRGRAIAHTERSSARFRVRYMRCRKRSRVARIAAG